jgi:hypothetical protein
MRAEYTQLITPAERAAAIKLGMASVLARNRISIKKADVTPGSLFHGTLHGAEAATKAILAAALITGAPIGAVAHVMGRKIKGNQKSEKESLSRIKYYRDISRQLETGLAS